jgi:hypothetical protein
VTDDESAEPERPNVVELKNAKQDQEPEAKAKAPRTKPKTTAKLETDISELREALTSKVNAASERLDQQSMELQQIGKSQSVANADGEAARRELMAQAAKTEELAARQAALEQQDTESRALLDQTNSRLATFQQQDTESRALLDQTNSRLATLEARLAQFESKMDYALHDMNERLSTFPTSERVPGILLTTMPKSGSVYIMRTLARSIDVEFMTKNAAHGFYPTYFLIPKQLDYIGEGNVVRHEHFDASPINISMLLAHEQRLVLNLRDPRQALLSWTHHINRLLAEWPRTTNYTLNEPPPEYLTWSFQTQLDWQIETHLRSTEQWLRSWINHTGEGSPLRVLITRFEELVADEAAFFARIVEFFGVPPGRFRLRPAQKTIANNFRLGSCDEWRSVFTDAQKARAVEVVGADVLQHFGWEL